MFEPLFKSAPVRRPAKVYLLPYDVRLREFIILAVFRKSYKILPLISVLQLQPLVLHVHPSSCIKILDTRASFFFCQ